MEKYIIEAEDSSLDIAEQKLRSQIPEGYLLMSKKIVSDGKPKSIRCIADTPEKAFSEALREVPIKGKVISRVVLVRSGKEIVTVRANNEKEALLIAKRNSQSPLGENIKSMRVLGLNNLSQLETQFGQGNPNTYEVEIRRQAIVEVTYYKTRKAKVVGEIGLDKGPLLEAVQSGEPEDYKRQMTSYLISIGRPTDEIAEIISNQLNLELLTLLKTVLNRCERYRALTNNFLKDYYFSLGPRISILLSTHFFTEAIESHHIDYESDLRHLLYLLQPQQPPYSKDALEFDKELDAGKLDNENLEKIKLHIEDLKALSKPKSMEQLIEQLISDPSLWKASEQLVSDPSLWKASEQLVSDPSFLRASPHLLNASVRIWSEKNKISVWLNNAILTLKQADTEEKNTQTAISNENHIFKQLNFSFFEVIIGLLRDKNLMYEASCFCDSVNEVIQDNLPPQRVRAIMARSRADFLKLAYKKSIQELGEDKNQPYKVQGPVYFVLQNQIQECAVDFFVVGPTIEQITLPKASEGDNQTYFDVKPGRYVVVCEPKMPVPPLILEGNCLPGRQYRVGIQLEKRQGLSVPQVYKLEDGIPIDIGLFGAIDIDPLHTLELLFGGRKYQLQNYLGEGSGGIIYQAIDLENKSASAFKFMTTDLLGSNSQIEIGKQEWQIYNNLESKKCIIGILGFSEDLVFIQEEKEKRKKKAIAAYQMEYANQGNLAAYLANKQGDLPSDEIVTILNQIGLGLEAIHKAGLLHRDVRPQNILVFQDNPRYRICDFTLTKSKKDLILEQLNGVFNRTNTKFGDGFIERRTTSTLLSLHRVIGSSTFYAAPEEHEGSGMIDVRSDIYSVGGILYWLLTGFEPFELILRDRYRNLYEQYKLAMESHILKLDFQHRKALFGNLQQLEFEMRNTSLRLKKQEPLNIDMIEIQYSGISENLFLHFKDFIAKTVQPDPGNRFQTVLEMQAAIHEMEKVT